MSDHRSSRGFTGDALPDDALGEALRSFPMMPAPEGLVAAVLDRTVGASRRAARRRLVALAVAAALAIAALGAWLVTIGLADDRRDDRPNGRTNGLANGVNDDGSRTEPAATAEEEEELARLDDGVRRALHIVAGTLARAERIAVDRILAAEAGHAASLLPLRPAGASADQTGRTSP